VHGVNAHVKNDANLVKVFKQLLEDEQEQCELLRAVDHPDAAWAKHVKNKHFPHFWFSGKDVPCGFVGGFKPREEVAESSKRHQMPSGFIEFSFTDLGNPRSMRVSFHTVTDTSKSFNEQFPAEPSCQHSIVCMINDCDKNKIKLLK